MATQKDKRSSLLNFDRGEKWVAPAEIARQKEEEQRAALEKERRNAPVDWSNVKTGSDTFVKPQEEPSGFANLINQIVRPTTDYVGDMGTMAKADIKAGLGARMFTHDDIGDGAGAEVGRSLYDSLNIQGGGPISSLLQTLSGNREDTGELGKRLYQEANATKSEVNKEYKDSNWAAQGGIDLAGSPLSALSVIGGPTAFLTGEDVFNKTYADSRLAGASQEASAARAGANAAIETGISAIPAGKLLEKIPYVKKLVPREGLIKVMGDAQQFAVKTGLTMAGESAEEVTTTLAQLGLDKLISEHASDEGIRKVAEANLPKNTVEFWDSIRRTAVAGAGGGLAMGSPIEAMNIMKESGAAASQMLTNIDAASKDQIRTPVLADAPRSTAIKPTVTGPAPTQTDMFGTPEGLPSFEEHTATRQRNLEIDEGLRQGRNALNQEEALATSREEQRLNLEGSVDSSRQRVEALQERIQAGDTSQETLSAMSAAVRDTKRAENLLANHNATKSAVQETATTTPTPSAIKEAEQPDLFQMQEQNELAQQKAAALKTREGATKIVKKDDAAIKASAAQKRAAEKREHLKGVVEATRGLPEAERVDAIANASQDWDLNNPQEKYVQAAVKAATSTPAAKKNKAKKPVATVADEIDGLLSGLAKGDENSNPTTGVKVADVARSLVSTFGQGNTKKLAKLINDRNLEVVADVSQIPEGAAPAGAHGFYDGNRMYVVANRLDPNNIVGGMLEIVAHEVKHAADISGKVTMGEFVGKKANASLNAQIRQAAARGDVAAQRAMEAAKAGSNSAAEFALELPAYYINESRDTRGASRTAILRDALSAVRTTAKRIMPGTYEVSLKDVAYLSDKLITEAAVQGKKLDGDINGGLAMIYDETATGFDKAKAESRTYESADGTEKFVLSDADAKLHPDAYKRLGRRSSRVTKLSDILEHDVLFEQHPEAKDIEIYVASEAEMGDSFGLYLPTDIVSNGFITIRKDVAEGHNQGNTLREALMHEIQHWVQDRSARRDNFFDKNKLPKPEGYDAWQKEYKESRRANDKANRKFLDNAKLIRELVMPGAVKNVDRVLFDKNLEDHQKVREILDYLEDADALDDPRIESLAAGVASTKVAHNDAAKKVNDGLDDYFKNLTEREAFYTQDSIDTPQEKLPVNPEADMRVDSPDGSLRSQEGERLPKSKGLASVPLPKNPQTETSAFKKWFGNSKVVDKSGDPLVVYHGSPTVGIEVFNTEAVTDRAENGDAAGAYFSESASHAYNYTQARRKPGEPRGPRTRGSMTAAYLSLQNPLNITADILRLRKKGVSFGDAKRTALEKLDRSVHDGIIFDGNDGNPAEYVAFKPTQIKSATDNNGDFDSENPRMLAYVPRSRKTAEKVENTKRLSKRVFLPGGGFEAALEEAGLHSKSLPAGMSVKATSLGQTLKDNIDKVASSLDIPVKELNDKLDAALTKINELETKDARDSAINALDRTYPGVGTALRAIRDFKWEMTLDLIHMRKRDSDRPLTKKELNTYKSMIKNAETYTTRAYLATYNRDIGAEYAESLMSHYDQDPTSEEGKKIAVAIKYLVDNTLLVPDEATMNEMTTQQVRRLHDNWLTPSDKLKGIAGKKAMIKALLKLDEHTQVEMEEKALEIVRDMLGLNEVKGSVAASYAFSKGAKQNRTILESRTDLPIELRQMMGEITDPVLREAITMHRMIQLTAKTKLLTEIMEKGKDKGWWSDARTSENKTKLDDIAYGPMNGKWINDDVKDMLTGRLLSLRTDDQKIADAIHNPTLMSEILAGRGVRATQALSRIQKTATIVMDVSQMGLNFVGAFSNVALNGFPVTHMLKGMQVAAIAGAGDVSIKLVPKELLAILEEVTTAGALDSATVGDLKGQASEAITSAVQALTDAQRSNPSTVFHTAVRAAKKHGSTTLVAFRQAYAFMDVWVKVATYLSNKEFYTKFNEAEGKGWTKEDIQRRSGYEASGTNISYERAIPLFKVLEKSSPFHMFATYFSEVYRSVGMSYLQAYRDFALAKEATTPEGRNMAMLKGTKRLTGTLLATAGLIAYTMSKLNAEDDDERKRRNLVDPEWNRDKIPFVIGKDKDGNDVVWYMNIMDPNGPLNDPIISILNAKPEDKPRVAMKAVLDLMVPSKGVLSVGKVMWDALIHSAAAVSGNDRLLTLDTKTNKNTVTEANYPKSYTAIKRMLNAGDIGVNAVQAFESLFMVGTVKPWIDDRGNVVKEAGVGRKAAAETGLSVTTRDPDKALKYKVYDYQDKIKKLGQEKKELLKDAQYMDSGDMMEALTGVLKEERKAFDTLRGHYEGYMAFDGKNASGAQAAFGTQGKKLAEKIRQNNFTSSVVTLKSLDDWYLMQNKDPKVDKKELVKEYRLLKSAYTGAMNGKD